MGNTTSTLTTTTTPSSWLDEDWTSWFQSLFPNIPNDNRSFIKLQGEIQSHFVTDYWSFKDIKRAFDKTNLSVSQAELEEAYKYLVNHLTPLEQKKLITRLTENDADLRARIGTDICFLVDCTASMKEYIGAVKEHIYKLHNKIVQELAIQPRYAFVGYRDLCDKEEQIVMFSKNQERVRRGSVEDVLDNDFNKTYFTKNSEEIKTFLTSVEAKGGGDVAEDYCEPYRMVLQLDWFSNNRVLIHFADTPCHGTVYHNFEVNLYDNYDHHVEYGNDRKVEDYLRRLLTHAGIKSYVFSQINDTTDKMIDIFRKTLPIRKMTFTPSDHVKLVAQLVTASLLVFSTVITDYTLTVVDPLLKPDKNAMQSFKVNLYNNSQPDEKTLHIYRQKSFAEGATRYAYYAYNGDEAVIVKSWKGLSACLSEKRCIDQMLCHQQALVVSSLCQLDNLDQFCSRMKDYYIYFIKHFELLLPIQENIEKNMDGFNDILSLVKGIEILPMFYFQFTDGKDKNCYWCYETTLKSFVKYTNNGGWSNGDNDPIVAHIFSHLSFLELTMQLDSPTIVVDIQGEPKRWTDMALHCYGSTDYGNTNLGKDGISLFFKSHNQFNYICCQILGFITEENIYKMCMGK